MTRVTLFADILLPLPLKGVFTYRVPYVLNDQLKEGQRVIVPFGKSKKYAGLVKHIHTQVPESYQVKYIESVIDERPVVKPIQFAFWEWVASYYMCTPGEVMHAALPHNIKEIQDKKWHPKTVDYVRLTASYDQEEGLKRFFDHAEKRAPRQLELMVAYIRLSGRYETTAREVARKDLTESIKDGHTVLSALVKKGVFDVYEKEQSRFGLQVATVDSVQLNAGQHDALSEINKGFADHQVVLLHGVTSSGKTELYIQLIRDQLARGKQVLYLLPEIALTTQIIQRLRNHFGDKAAVYHSRFNPMERVEVWNSLLEGGISVAGEQVSYDLVLGPRSALFLPFDRLGLIIVDEEHDASYKQQEPAPRYHARDAAIYLAGMYDAKVLLGSATPSLETFHNVQTGKFGLAKLTKRFGGVLMPDIQIADIRKETFSRRMKSHLTSLLHRAVGQALENKEQVILFQNRRGFSPRLECELCDWSPVCHQCDVTMVYHKKNNQLRCHYCGYISLPPAKCPSCEATAIKMRGFGTEKIEEEIPVFFPDARVARMDMDTMRAKNAYHDLITDFENQQIDILVGTQMVSKGLDFSHVGLVGILNADNMFGFPDFRAHERAFQMLAQVSGRAGRLKKQGRVIIQTYHPDHQIIKQVIANDYQAMYEAQLAERRKFLYPPFTRLIQLTLMHKDSKTLDAAADVLARSLKKAFPGKVLGPEYPLVSRVRNLFIKHMLVKLHRNQQLSASRSTLLAIAEAFKETTPHKQLRLLINVDPQ